MELDRPESIPSSLENDPNDKFLEEAKKATVNYCKRVTQQFCKKQQFYLRRFFMKKF